MIITCMQSLTVSYPDKDGKIKQIALRPGSYNYPMLDHKDPMVAEQLRVFRKHTRVGFDEILESDKPVLSEIPADEPKKAEILLAKTGLKENPVGRKVKGKKNAKSGKKPSVSAPKSSKKGDSDPGGGEVSE